MTRSAIRQPLYPNAADPRYFAEKARQILASLVCGVGTMTIMMLLLTMT